MNAKGYAINGKFLCEKITGMQRAAIELVNELDKLYEKGEFSIIVPEVDEMDYQKYKNITIIKYGEMNPDKKAVVSFGNNIHCQNILENIIYTVCTF